MAGTDDCLVEISGLKTWFGSRHKPVKAVDGVSLRIREGETVALVGESGCGKSVTALSMARLVPEPPGFYEGGSILLDGQNVLEMSDRELRQVRGRKIGYIFQEPGSSLNPVVNAGDQIAEAIRLHRKGTGAREEVIDLMQTVGLPDPARRIKAYPHELSGGMQQRTMIAMALACRPSLLVADEPTTSLDVTIQAQILELMKRLQSELRMAILLITHNLGLVAEMAHYIYVMYAGRVVETGPAEDVLRHPSHPYTRGLLNAVPNLESWPGKGKRITGIPGSVPDPSNLPPACKFAPRCPRAKDPCLEKEPVLEKKTGKNREVRCNYPYT